MNQYSEVTYYKQLRLPTRYVTVDVQSIPTKIWSVAFSCPGPCKGFYNMGSNSTIACYNQTKGTRTGSVSRTIKILKRLFTEFHSLVVCKVSVGSDW